MRRDIFLAFAALLLSGLIAATGALGRPATSRALVKTSYNAKLKRPILVDSRGMSLYLFTADTGGTPNCIHVDPRCPKIWPALATVGAPRAGTGIDASLLGTTKGAHGVTQVTYNRHPLYTFYGEYGTVTGDRTPGQVRGQGLFGAWFVLSPKGVAIRR